MLEYSIASCGVHCGAMGPWAYDTGSILRQWVEKMLEMDTAASERPARAMGRPYPHPAFVVFSDTTIVEHISERNGFTSPKGRRVAKAISELGLGDVTQSPPALNPNSGHEIEVFVWRVNYPALMKWYKELS